MKKLLAVMMVALLCVPAIAAVDVTLADNGDGSFNILVNTNGDGVRGLALTVTTAGTGLDIASSSFAEFNTCIDWAYSNGGYDAIGDGHPFAIDGDAGVATDGDTTFVVSMGYLDQAEGQAAWSSTEPTVVATVMVGAGEVCVTEDTLRGGIVGDAELTVNPIDCITVTEGTVCLGDFNDDGAISGADVQGFIDTFGLVLGQDGYNPLGDFNGDDAVSGADVSGFIAVFGTLCD